MDWSLIILLFAVGFALAGLAFLISTVSKVMSKPPPSQNIPPTIPQPPPYQQPPAIPTYNWSLNGARVQKLALGQGSGEGGKSPTYSGEQLSMGQPEETEPGLIPISYSVVPAQLPVFSPEPVHQAQRVYEAPKPAPMPHSVAIPVDETPEPNAVATPASYFREPPTIQDVSGRKIKEVVNRANRASSVATPINPNGEARGFFHDNNVIEVINVEVSDRPNECVPIRDNASFHPDQEPMTEFNQYPPTGIQFTPESAPTIVPESNPEPASEPVSEPEPVPELISNPESAPVSVPEPDPIPVSEPDLSPEAEPVPDTILNDNQEPTQNSPNKPATESDLTDEDNGKEPHPKPVKKKRARGKNRRKQQSKTPQKKTPPIPNAPPAERVVSSKEDEKKPDEKPMSKEQSETEEKLGIKERILRNLRAFIGGIVEKIPEPIRNIAGPVLFCTCVAVCLVCLSLFTYFDKHPYVPEKPSGIVDIPTEVPEPEPEPEPEKEPVSVIEEEPRYKMTLLGEQEAVSTTAEGFEPDFETADYTNVPFYALSFAIQLDSNPGTEFQKIQVYDANTKEDLTSTATSILHVYSGEIPSEEYLLTHPVKSAPVISSAVSDEIITCVFISLEKRSISDLEVILYQATSGIDALTKKKVTVNSNLEDLSMTTAYPMGNSLMKLGNQYYVAEPGTGIGAVPDENKYVTRKIRCVSLPLTGSPTGLDASSTALFDRQTGAERGLPVGTEMYYQENYVEGSDVMEISFGIQLSGGSYEEAAAFLDSSFPGYILDGQSIMF